MVRAFLAIDLPWDLKREIYSLKNLEIPKDLKLKWVEEENLHITLKFLGNISENLLEKIYKNSENICKKFASFYLELEEIGSFPEKGIPRVIWIGINRENALKTLYEQLEKNFKSLKLEEKKEKFHPHITLIRVKEALNREALINYFESLKGEAKKLKGRSFLVKEIIFFKSTLTPTSPKYTPLKRITFKDYV